MATRNTTSNRSLPKDAAAALATFLPIPRKGLLRNRNTQDQDVNLMQTRAKRKADNSPIKNEKIKRSALGNLTNNTNLVPTTTTTQHPDEDAKHQNKQKQQIGKKPFGVGHVLKTQQQQQQPCKITTRAAAKNAAKKSSGSSLAVAAKNLVKNENVCTVGPPPPKASLLPPPAPVVSNALIPSKTGHKSTRRISNEFNQTEDSLYMSALEDVSSSESMRLSGNFEAAKRRSILLQQQQQQQDQQKEDENKQRNSEEQHIAKVVEDEDDGNYKDELSFIIVSVPENVEDFDKANWNDPFQVSNYAMDIFIYLKSRESQFPIDNYIVRQVHLSKWMRSLLVDWMVEVQETFELNHETLYLAVKIVDLFLCKVVIHKERLQLLGAAALFISCKYEERTPTMIEDFLYICDGAYNHDELVKMEMTVLRTIDFDLGIPLSYRFLRRYARCSKVPMPTLTLARYALELSLMDYEIISLSDSRLACAALFIALRLHGEPKAWSPTLEHYTGYKLIDFADIVPILNAGMHRKPKGTIKNIRNKYSHKIFYEVAKVKLMSTEKLFEHELVDLNISQKLKGDNNSSPSTAPKS